MEAPHLVDSGDLAGLPHLAGEYRRRRPDETVLYKVIQENYQTFAHLREEEGRPLVRASEVADGEVCRGGPSTIAFSPPVATTDAEGTCTFRMTSATEASCRLLATDLTMFQADRQGHPSGQSAVAIARDPDTVRIASERDETAFASGRRTARPPRQAV